MKLDYLFYQFFEEYLNLYHQNDVYINSHNIRIFQLKILIPHGLDPLDLLCKDIDSLRMRNWESWRLDKWDRIDIEKINQGVKSCREKSGHFFGYDYSGMFSIWNENLKPETVKDFGDEYICSTAVVTLLYFGGFESDSTPRQELDLITPFQVVRAKGAFIDDDPKPKD